MFLFDLMSQLIVYGSIKNELKQVKVCDRCKENKEQKYFIYYKQNSFEGVDQHQYMIDLKKKIETSLEITGYFNLNYLLEDYGYSADYCICRSCCDDIFNKLKIDIDDFFRKNDIKTFSSRYQGRIFTDNSVEPYGFCHNGYPEEKELLLNQLKFFAYREGYDALVDLDFSYSRRNVQITGKMVKLAPKPAKKTYNRQSSLSNVEQLEKLAKLKADGILSESEFQREKNKILSK